MRVLHKCQALGDVVEGGPLVYCDQAASLWTAPSGNTFFVCPRHVELITKTLNETGPDGPQRDGARASS